MDRTTTVVEFLSGRAGSILLTASIFMFLIGLHVSGHGGASIDVWLSGFGGALLNALSNELRGSASSTVTTVKTPGASTQTETHVEPAAR